ncbi:MAG: GGDEF domain-containing protein [Burkholderiales bacterium]
MNDTATVLSLICLQQGLCAMGWFVAGRWLGLTPRVAMQWAASALASAAGLGLILQRGIWPPALTWLAANLLILLAFVLIRRGVQVFLRIRVTDAEHAALLALDGLLLAVGLYATDPTWAVVCVSVPIAWTLLRAAFESHRRLAADEAIAAARAVALPLGLLGVTFAIRAMLGALAPELAARPLSEANAFNTGIAMAFMMGGLILNMVLALLVVARMVRRLRQRSLRDALTGLLNRRALGPLLRRQVGRLRRYGETYAVLMVDVDHFKSINDSFGHAVGDAALIELARLMREAARDVDHIVRMGGEEFCLLLPHTDLDGALRLGGRLREVVGTADARACVPMTVSVGVAVAQSADEPADAVIARADAALYRAKAGGRDRVVLAEPPAPAHLQAA